MRDYQKVLVGSKEELSNLVEANNGAEMEME
jgi:hypothetical protein